MTSEQHYVHTQLCTVCSHINYILCTGHFFLPGTRDWRNSSTHWSLSWARWIQHTSPPSYASNTAIQTLLGYISTLAMWCLPHLQKYLMPLPMNLHLFPTNFKIRPWKLSPYVPKVLFSLAESYKIHTYLFKIHFNIILPLYLDLIRSFSAALPLRYPRSQCRQLGCVWDKLQASFNI